MSLSLLRCKTSDGKSLVEINANGVKITGNLPRFVGIYPGAKVTSSIAGGDSNGAGGTLVMESSAAPADVIMPRLVGSICVSPFCDNGLNGRAPAGW